MSISVRQLMAALLFVSFLPTNSEAATSGINPNYLKLKIYKVAISTSPLCTNLVTVYSNSAPTYTDFLANPTLGSGAVSNDSYPCIAIEFSDTLKFAPAATSDNNHCVANTESTINVCSSGTSTMIDGSSTTCTAAEERVTMWLSTASTQTTGTSGHNAFQPPATTGDATKGFRLGSALEVSGTKSGTFVVNGSGKIEENGTSCDMQPPTFSFR